MVGDLVKSIVSQLGILSCLNSIALIVTINQSLNVETMLVVEDLQQIYPSTIVFLSFDALPHNAF